ncbi:MAG: hypothetical protein Q9218_000254 [Villophora microphyllina]
MTTTPPAECIPPGYQLQFTIPNPTTIFMSTSRSYIQHTLNGIDAERCFLETGLRHLRRQNFMLKIDMEENPKVTDEMSQHFQVRRKYTHETMSGMELEVLKNVTIRMVTDNRLSVQEQHRLRDENEALKQELEETATERMGVLSPTGEEDMYDY